MKHVGVRELRDNATRYLSAGEALAVERHGKLIGFYLPAEASGDEEVREALERLEKAVERVRTESGIAEDELGDALDLNRPAS